MKLIVLVLTAFFCRNVYSQRIKGTVTDSQNQKLPYANVYLKSNNTIVNYTAADEEGKYELVINKKGTFDLSFSALNYESLTQVIEISGEIELLTANAVLQYKPIALNEINIVSEKQITQKKDTIVFNAKSFAKGNEKVVEDLLKQIPGLIVSNDGTVKVGNQEVEKIMIEGDDFFEKGYRLLTKNMPSKPIDKIELYHNYSSNKHLKSIENSGKVALNLKLKDDAKRQWFGDMQLGYGLGFENRYEIHNNLMNFGKKNKFYFLSSLNNTGKDAIGDINHLIKSTGIRNQNSGLFARAPKISMNNETPNLKEERVNFNNAEMISLNNILTLTEKIKLKTLFFFNSDENDFFKNSFESFTAANTGFENNQIFSDRKTTHTAFGMFDLNYDISKNKTLQYSGKWSQHHQKIKSDLLFNTDLINQKLNHENSLFDQKIVFTNALKNNKVFLVSGGLTIEKLPQQYTTNTFLYEELFVEKADGIEQNINNKSTVGEIKGQFIDKRNNGSLFEIEFGNTFIKDQLVSIFSLLSSEKIIGKPSDYQNQLLYKSNDLYLNGKYQFAFQKINIVALTEFHQFFNTIDDSGETKTQQPFFINPKITANWQPDRNNRINLSYSYSKKNAEIVQVFKNYINTGFRSFSKGTGDFNQIDASNFTLNHSFGNWSNRFFINTAFTYIKNHDFFSTNTTLAQNYSQAATIIIKNRQVFNVSANVDRYFKMIASNIKCNVETAVSNYKNQVNAVDLEIKNNLLSYGFEVRSGFKGIFNYHLGFQNNYNEIKVSGVNSYTDNVTFLDLYFKINKKINVQLQGERYYFGNLEKSNNSYYFSDAEIRFDATEKLTFFITANNLLNTKVFKDYSITDISVSKTEYKLQPRYIMLKLEFRF